MNSISRLREGNDLEQRRCSLAWRIANLILRICLNAASGLDLGASDGALAGEFVKYGIKFYGVEPSLDDKEAERNRGQIRKGWAHSIPFENGVFDVVLLTSAYEHIFPENRLQRMKEIYHVLKSGLLLGH